jgi:7-cyano-7-deazaguanine tRNA-ribosyltransferase
VLVVAGLSLKNLHPRVWDSASPYHLPKLRAVMVSYADFHRNPARRRAAMEAGLHAYLSVPDGVEVYLDNGAFYFLARDGGAPHAAYEEFVAAARPDWWPIPQDFIPLPRMSEVEQRACFDRTMTVNLAYRHDGFVPVIHIGSQLGRYTAELVGHESLSAKPALALGGLVPNLLRAPKAMAYGTLLQSLRHVREAFAQKRLHVFGIGGTATLHLAALLGLDSVDSSGWRNRAARGIVQLAGSGDRVVADLGSWRGRRPSAQEWETLAGCECPACRRAGLEGLQARRLEGFCNRATHNLWVLLEEAEWIARHLANGTYTATYRDRLDNSIYLPLITQVLSSRAGQPLQASATQPAPSTTSPTGSP